MFGSWMKHDASSLHLNLTKGSEWKMLIIIKKKHTILLLCGFILDGMYNGKGSVENDCLKIQLRFFGEIKSSHLETLCFS